MISKARPNSDGSVTTSLTPFFCGQVEEQEQQQEQEEAEQEAEQEEEGVGVCIRG